MQTFFRHPDELFAEVAEAGFATPTVYGVEGPGWPVPEFDAWGENGDFRYRLLELVRALESEPRISAVSAHLIAVATK